MIRHHWRTNVKHVYLEKINDYFTIRAFKKKVFLNVQAKHLLKILKHHSRMKVIYVYLDKINDSFTIRAFKYSVFICTDKKFPLNFESAL